MTPKKRTRQFAALLIASALSVSVSNSAVASAEEFQDHGAKGGFASGVMAELLGEAAPAFTTYWASVGRKVRYPAGGGTWEYGFWNAKARSYFTVNRCHTSTVTVNDRRQRSINTRGGQKSIAELWATNLPGTKDSYYYNFC